jgi:hypothetical protein
MIVTRVGAVAPATAGPRRSGSGGGAARAACRPAVGFRSVAVRPRGAGLRFAVSRAQRRSFDVAVFRQSAGRRVLGNRLAARFRGRSRSFAWSGRGARDGDYVVRVSMRLTAGRTDVRRFALRRSGRRFTVRPAYYRRASCGTLASFKLERPVFGGTRNRALGIAFRIAAKARVTVTVTRAGRTVRRFAPTTRSARTTHRLRLASERLPRGTYRVRITVAPPGARAVAATLVARRL